MKLPNQLLLAAALLMCCGSISPLNADSATPAETAAPRPTVAVGMTADQVREVAGKPGRIKPLKKEGLVAEVWFYNFDKVTEVKDIAARIREVPYIDPLTGRVRMVPEPAYSQQRTVLTETTELLMIDGTLTGAKRYRKVRRDLD